MSDERSARERFREAIRAATMNRQDHESHYVHFEAHVRAAIVAFADAECHTMHWGHGDCYTTILKECGL